jgi:hypothetical protein
MKRLYHRIIARLCWWDNDRLKADRAHTVRLLMQLEMSERRQTSARRIAEIQAALRIERAHLAGIDYAMRANNQRATRAAMAARI